jgi:HK97 gp10 family phage protein
MVKITGSKAFSARLKRIGGLDMEKAVGAALFAAGTIIGDEAALLITTGAVGGRNHVASLPGEPPNADTGGLDRSIEVHQTGPMTVEVSANAPYAAALEFGTSKMAERPYMRPAVARKRKEAIALVRKAIRDVVVGGKRLPGTKGS